MENKMSEEITTTIENIENAAEFTKRKRGRPKKSDVYIPPIPKVKGKRGRPKKTDVTPSTPSTLSVMGKRGRPRIDPSQNVTLRMKLAAMTEEERIEYRRIQKERTAAYRLKYPEKVKESLRKSRYIVTEDGREIVKPKLVDNSKNYYQKNKEIVLARQKESRANAPEDKKMKVRERLQEYKSRPDVRLRDITYQQEYYENVKLIKRHADKLIPIVKGTIEAAELTAARETLMSIMLYCKKEHSVYMSEIKQLCAATPKKIQEMLNGMTGTETYLITTKKNFEDLNSEFPQEIMDTLNQAINL